MTAARENQHRVIRDKLVQLEDHGTTGPHLLADVNSTILLVHVMSKSQGERAVARSVNRRWPSRFDGPV